MKVTSTERPSRTALLSRLRRWRVANGLTLGDVSDLSGLSPAMLSRVERGERVLRPRTKVLVARRLGVPVADLFDPAAEIDDPAFPCDGAGGRADDAR